jgi:hypothetical protein
MHLFFFQPSGQALDAGAAAFGTMTGITARSLDKPAARSTAQSD